MQTGLRSTHASFAVLALVAGAIACGSTSTLPTPVGVRSRVDTTWYDVPGRTPREWSVASRDRAADAGVRGGFRGQTSWTTRWSYPSTRMTSRGCEAVEPRVEAEIRFVMPRLVDDSLVRGEDRAEWQRYLTSLWVHENGHALRALRSTGVQLAALRNLRTPICAHFGPEVKRVMEDIYQRHREYDRLYDEATRHGARQGALLIVDRSRRLPVDTTYRDTLP